MREMRERERRERGEREEEDDFGRVRSIEGVMRRTKQGVEHTI